MTRYICSKCKLLLKDPVQFSCGHRICKSCADEILAKDFLPRCPKDDCGEVVEVEDGKYVVRKHAEYM